MAWTYIPSQLSTSSLYRARLALGLKNPEERILQDAEIEFLITDVGGDEKLALGDIAQRVAMVYVRLADQTTGAVSVSHQSRAESWIKMADRYRRKLGSIFVGGAGKADVNTRDLDDDRTEDTFAVGMHDNPGSIDNPSRTNDLDC